MRFDWPGRKDAPFGKEGPQLSARQVGSELARISDKVFSGERLSFEEGVALYRSSDLHTVGALANRVREKWNGNVGYFNVNRHLNPTNVCVVDCKFCGFARKPGKGGYTMSLEEAYHHASMGYSESVTEFHIVGGLHPYLPFSYYTDLLRGLKERFPKVHLKAFTMVELDFFSRRAKLSIDETILALREAGMDSCPGGGAEIFAERPRDIICDHKVSGDRWLEIAKRVHLCGLKSNATMLYGHVETVEDRVDHLIRLRELQDETQGFQCFIPLAFHPANTQLDHLPSPTAMLDLRTIAVSRLMLDNFPHIKAYWIMIGAKTAQMGLHYGADDLDGTVVEEKIVHMAGAQTPLGLTRAEIEHLIREAGREPVERDTLYRPVNRVAAA
ncbi:MAG: aminofutalosine synthase MqnE [Acidobacteria bacterium]|nr:aminofutalosine synthase MqnE [Acidobacteriota bacterium]